MLYTIVSLKSILCIQILWFVKKDGMMASGFNLEMKSSNIKLQQLKSINHQVKSNIVSSSLAVLLLTATTTVSKNVLATTGSSGVDDSGLFELCSDNNNNLFNGCVSSQDDRPSYFLPPWCYDGPIENAKRKVLDKIINIPGANIKKSTNMVNEDRLIIVEFKNNDNSIDDAEFYFTPNDNTIQYRSICRNKNYDFGRNRQRIESLRLSLRYENIPVLRNRKTVLFFIESPLDEFGPNTNQVDQMIDHISKSSPVSRGVVGELDPLFPVWELAPSIWEFKIRTTA